MHSISSSISNVLNTVDSEQPNNGGEPKQLGNSSKKLPHMPWYGDDYESDRDVKGMDPLADLAYRKLLWAQWASRGEGLPGDLEELASLSGWHDRKVVLWLEKMVLGILERYEVFEEMFGWRSWGASKSSMNESDVGQLGHLDSSQVQCSETFDDANPDQELGKLTDHLTKEIINEHSQLSCHQPNDQHCHQAGHQTNNLPTLLNSNQRSNLRMAIVKELEDQWGGLCPYFDQLFNLDSNQRRFNRRCKGEWDKSIKAYTNRINALSKAREANKKRKAIKPNKENKPAVSPPSTLSHTHVTKPVTSTVTKPVQEPRHKGITQNSDDINIIIKGGTPSEPALNSDLLNQLTRLPWNFGIPKATLILKRGLTQANLEAWERYAQVHGRKLAVKLIQLHLDPSEIPKDSAPQKKSNYKRSGWTRAAGTGGWD